ncbi:MYG1 family protein [Rubellicoccus peritrichatus]|uniref:MYG1 family protein n=1 Tax=Rubellicoccus peritrichatus TaxID=3080537 RepID=A0AAQ3L6I4_9BACT|nr:MYG1 family protein [Puniceicoccus sp. CR14]WOO39986.1 MYG1 family protein [Puniceicoccus sp. CR14]
MENFKLIVTHPGGAHKDDLLACCVLLAVNPSPIERREPTAEDLDDSDICVVDVGHEHKPEKRNFDHHQFPRDHEPTCSLSLVLQYLGVYEDARKFCDWLEPAEWFDCRGAKDTAKWLGIERDIVTKLNSPIDVTILRRFARESRLDAGSPIWELMKMIGDDLLDYLKNLRSRLDYVGETSEVWELNNGSGLKVLFMPRTDPLPTEPSMGLGRYIEELDPDGKSFVGMIYPDRRGDGYGLSRFNDDLRLDFTKIDEATDVHFTHASGFIAKTSATNMARLRELLEMAYVEELMK